MQNSYFELPHPWLAVERWLNPPVHSASVKWREEPLTVNWTRRAARQLARRDEPLLAEMQLYFTCVVKKRVVFHETPPEEGLEVLTVTPQLQVAFRPVEANSCDPREFAANFPVRREFHTAGALKMHPVRLHLDYKKGAWLGEFTV
jgi:hypothetical protein